MSDCKCFMIPSVSIPQNTSYTVWYAAWSPDRPGIAWTSTPPDLEPGMLSTWIGVALEDAIPQDATVVGTYTKEIPPPPSAFSQSFASVSDFQQAFALWLSARAASGARGMAARSA